MDRKLILRKGIAAAGIIAGAMVLSLLAFEVARHVFGLEPRLISYALALGMPLALGIIVVVPLLLANARLQQTQEGMQQLALVDGVSGLANRRGFFGDSYALMGEAAPSDGAVVALMVEVDGFAAINRSYGRAGGDQILRFVAAHMRQILSEAKAGEKIAGRLGGAEFAVLLTETSPSDASALAERLCDFVRSSRTVIDGDEVGATISVGVATARAGANIDDLLSVADGAVAQAQQQGGNRWIFGGAASPSADRPPQGARAA